MPIAPDGTPLPYPEDGQQGLPPELLQMLAGGGAEQAPAEEELSFDDRIGRIISDARAAIDENGVTEAERLLFEQLTTLVQKIKANREKEQQAALGGGPATNFLRRASGGA